MRSFNAILVTKFPTDLFFLFCFSGFCYAALYAALDFEVMIGTVIGLEDFLGVGVFSVESTVFSRYSTCCCWVFCS